MRLCGDVHRSQAYKFVERVASVGAHEYSGNSLAASVTARCRVWELPGRTENNAALAGQGTELGKLCVFERAPVR